MTRDTVSDGAAEPDGAGPDLEADGDGATVGTGVTSACAGVTCSFAAGTAGIGRGLVSGAEIACAATPTASSYDGSEESVAFDCEGCGRAT